MELQFEKRSCRVLNRAAREVRNEELTQEVKLPDGMPDIGRVLMSWGQVILRSKQWRADTAAVSGGVMLWALYAPEDGTAPRCVDCWIPFTMKWDISAADREGVIRVMPLLRFADSRALSARKLMVRAGVAMLGEMLYPGEFQISCPGEMPEDVELLKNTYPLWLPRQAGEKSFTLDEEMELPGSAPVIEKIMSFTVRPEVNEQKLVAGKLVFRGNGNLHLIYRCADGNLHTWDFELPFSQYQDLEEELNEEVRPDTAMAVTSLELDLGEDGHLRLKCGLVCQYVIRSCEMVELVQDAYSSVRSAEPLMETLSLPVMLEQRREIISAEQTLMGKTGQIVDVVFLPDFPREYRAGEGIQLEIPAMIQVLYYAQDGSLQSAAARWEGRQQLDAAENSRQGTCVMPLGWGSGIASADFMELRGQLMLQLETTAEQGLPMVSALELGELGEPDPARPSLVLCRSQGESLWSLAKRWGSTVGAIQKANGIEEAQPDQMLLIPVS